MADRSGTDGRVVELHRLGRRRDGAELIVGRADTGTFVALPPAGIMVLDLLAEGLPEHTVQRLLRERTGRRTDVGAFVDTLVELGFAARVDGREVDGGTGPAPAATFARIRPQHVGWLLHPAVAATAGGLIAAGAVAALVSPAARPGPRDFFWHGHSALLLVGQTVLTWSLLFLHELAHLLTARACGAPARMSWSTRLFLLVAQTDVSGIWPSGRRHRLTVYLSGTAVDLALAAAALLVQTAVGHGRVLSLLVATAAVTVALQFAVFMRTDLYFVLQDLLRCRNLFGDASALWRHWLRPRHRDRSHPLSGLPARERAAVRAYAILMALGVATALTVGYLVWARWAFALERQALTALVSRPDLDDGLDAAITLALAVLSQGLWVRAWWRRHAARWRGALSRRRAGRTG